MRTEGDLLASLRPRGAPWRRPAAPGRAGAPVARGARRRAARRRPGPVARVGDLDARPSTVLAGADGGRSRPGRRFEGRVAEAEAEREGGLDGADVVPAVPGEDALLVAEHARVAVEEATACPRGGPAWCRAGGPRARRRRTARRRPPAHPPGRGTSTTAALGRGRPTTGRPASRPAPPRPCGAGRRRPPRSARPVGRGGRATSRSRPSVSHSSSRPTTTTAASACAAAATARSKASAGSGGAHRSSAGSRWPGRRSGPTSSSATGRAGDQLDLVGDRRAVDRERRLPLVLDLEAGGGPSPAA